ncbi:MAG: hypothetical protein EBY22_09955 [Gammaproteobacteria bacterium]|nr:hypothetical protein [Gammaproteobacteria bacterium]
MMQILIAQHSLPRIKPRAGTVKASPAPVDEEKEREADEFACKWTLTNEEVGKKLTVARPSL